MDKIGNKLSGYYNTWGIIEEFSYKNNKCLLLKCESKDEYYGNEMLLFDEENKKVIDDYEPSYDGFVKYIDDIEFYYGNRR